MRVISKPVEQVHKVVNNTPAAPKEQLELPVIQPKDDEGESKRRK